MRGVEVAHKLLVIPLNYLQVVIPRSWIFNSEFNDSSVILFVPRGVLSFPSSLYPD